MQKSRTDCIDFHAHILPGADHGSSSTETSRKQLERLSEAGVCKVLATPHFYPQEMVIDEFLNRRSRACEKIKTILGEGSPTVFVGAEVLLCQGLENMKDLDKLCIEGTNCILLEQPFYGLDLEIVKTAANIRRLGLYPIMAHIDRYPVDVAEAVFGEGLPCQINADSVTKILKRKRIIKYVDNGNICALGSDIHHADGDHASDYKKACDILGASRSDVLFARSNELLENAVPLN